MLNSRSRAYREKFSNKTPQKSPVIQYMYRIAGYVREVHILANLATIPESLK